jgi:ketosteroid isomerase-like protein
MVSQKSDVERVENLIHLINSAWLEGRTEDLATLFHPDIVMMFPNFSGRSSGSSAMVAGFKDFCENAHVHGYNESDFQIDVIGNSAIASYSFVMIYERDGSKYRSTGRDLWVFSKSDLEWKATWRTMLDVHEEPLS